MNYRKVWFTATATSRDMNHRFRKFQKSKLPTVVRTKPKMVMKLVEVKDEG